MNSLNTKSPQRNYSNSHVIREDLSSSPTYGQRSFSPVIRILHSTIEPICAMYLTNLG